MPSRPLLLGFAADTMFYGGLLAMVWYSPGTFRRWHRRRKGLCVHCAYPIADPASPCSECGKPHSSPTPAP